MALFSVAGSSLVGLNENMSCFSSCMGARGVMLSTEEFFPGRGIRIAPRISDCKSHEGWDGVVSSGKEKLGFGLVSAFRMGTCRCSDPRAHGTGV